MAPSRRQSTPLLVMPKLPDQILEDEVWRKQKQHALQVVIACQVYFSEHEKFPVVLSDALEIMNHNVREQNRMKRHFEFTDPANGTVNPWIYFPKAKRESNDILISSPISDHRLRIICTATGLGVVVTEDDYQNLIKNSGEQNSAS